MKSSDEMFNSLMERRDRYAAGQRRRREMIVRTVTPLCCLCLAAALGVGIWRFIFASM